MQQAAFSIINYQFDKVLIDLEKHNNNELFIKFNTNDVFENKTNTFELIFQVNVTQSKESEPFVKVRCKGMFKFENIKSFNEIPDFFYRNSIAILFPYLRAYISLVTTQANVPGIILPTLNLSSLEDDLRKKTTQK